MALAVLAIQQLLVARMLEKEKKKKSNQKGIIFFTLMLLHSCFSPFLLKKGENKSVKSVTLYCFFLCILCFGFISLFLYNASFYSYAFILKVSHFFACLRFCLLCQLMAAEFSQIILYLYYTIYSFFYF